LDTSILGPVAAILGFFGIWFVVIFLLMTKSGLKKLGENFPYQESRVLEPFTHTWHPIAIRSGGVRLKNAVTLRANKDGLLIVPSILFRYFAGKAFIPWEKIEYLAFKSETYYSWHEIKIAGQVFKIYNLLPGLEEFIDINKGLE
jgi:hypothetical protein